MSKNPQYRSSSFKLNVAVDAIKGEKTIVQLASEHGLHPRQITRWRNQLLLEGKNVFTDKRSLKNKQGEPGKAELIHIIDQLNLELEFLKKKLGE